MNSGSVCGISCPTVQTAHMFVRLLLNSASTISQQPLWLPGAPTVQYHISAIIRGSWDQQKQRDEFIPGHRRGPEHRPERGPGTGFGATAQRH